MATRAVVSEAAWRVLVGARKEEQEREDKQWPGERQREERNWTAQQEVRHKRAVKCVDGWTNETGDRQSSDDTETAGAREGKGVGSWVHRFGGSLACSTV